MTCNRPIDLFILDQDGETLLASMGAPDTVPATVLDKALSHEATFRV